MHPSVLFILSESVRHNQTLQDEIVHSIRSDRSRVDFSLTCADDAGRLHVPQESVDDAVVS